VEEESVEEEEGADPVSGEESYETTPEEATGFEKAPEGNFFNRKKIMKVLCVAFALVAGGGFLMNTVKNKPETKADGGGQAGRAPSEFLRNQLAGALAGQSAQGASGAEGGAGSAGVPGGGPGGPDGELSRPYAPDGVYPGGSAGVPGGGADGGGRAGVPPAPSGSGGGGGGGAAPKDTARSSPLVPRTIEGSLFGGRTGAAQANAGYTGQYPYLESGQGQKAAEDYLRQIQAAQAAQPPAFPAAPSGQNDKQAFFSAESGGTVNGGAWLGDNAVWTGTVVPAVLETAVSTDLPGNVLARVTRNIYDSRTGKNLLIPQGTLLVARYNSSVSYAQSRVQIVWDTLIRPDGFQLGLEGMNGVDKRGMSGQEAVYHENWFEYLKAAGVIAMFSIANSKMTETAAKYATDASASAIAESNSEFVNDVGGNIVSRAMNARLTLTVENGAPVNIMLNKTVCLPPAGNYPVTQKYRLE
jgi:hypothetical protein